MKKLLMILSLFFAVLALGPLSASAQTLPGKHPAYLHALTDLRTARWLLEHQPGDAKVYGDEDVAITQIDATIHDIKQASIDDNKDLKDHPAIDVTEHGSRLLRALELLKKVHTDISKEEDNPEARNLRRHALDHLNLAIHAADKAHDAWLKDVKK